MSNFKGGKSCFIKIMLSVTCMLFKSSAWDQSDNFVKIYLSGMNGVKELKDDAFELTLTKTSIFFQVKDLQGKNMIFTIKETPHNINGEKSYHKVKSDMVVLFLKKDEASLKWSHLKKSDKEAAEKTKFTPKADEGADPSANLMTMMKQMYDDGDDEMKRTITKAWTESQSGKKPPMMDL